MKQRLTRRVAVIAGTTVVALSGGAYAIAQSQNDGPAQERKAFLDDAAGRLKVSPEELTKALQGAAADRLDEAVRKGRLTQQQADAIKKRMQRDGGVPFLGPPGGPHGGPGFHHGPPPGMDAAADFLGLSNDALRRQLMSGRSLAQIARARDKSVDDLKAAIEKGIREHVAQDVKDKRLTQSQADQILKDLSDRVDDMVDRTGPPRHGRGRGGPPGGPGFGPPPPGAPGPGFGPPPGGGGPPPGDDGGPPPGDG
jgi:hypothetical protein